MCIVSPEDQDYDQLLTICKQSGFGVCEYSNKRLGEKINAGISVCKDYDYLMNWGSDNLMDADLFKLYKPYIDKGVKLFGIGDCTIYNALTKEAV